MAEFQEVMRQWVRARKATASNLDENVLSVYPLEDYDDRLIAAIEKNVMLWAEDHPEPVYPTWLEWMQDNGFIQPLILDASRYSNVECWLPGITARKPIPADIAQKLGIDPKAGGET